jgi:hypothetical protein
MAAERLLYGFRVLSGDLEQRFCRTVRTTPPLFPVPKRGDADADHQRELVL